MANIQETQTLQETAKVLRRRGHRVSYFPNHGIWLDGSKVTLQELFAAV